MSARLGAHPVALAMAPKVSHANRLKASIQAMPRPVPKGVSTGMMAEDERALELDKRALELNKEALKLAKQYLAWVMTELTENATTEDAAKRMAYEKKMVQVYLAVFHVDRLLKEDLFYFKPIMHDNTAEKLFFNMVGSDVAETLYFLRKKYSK